MFTLRIENSKNMLLSLFEGIALFARLFLSLNSPGFLEGRAEHLWRLFIQINYNLLIDASYFCYCKNNFAYLRLTNLARASMLLCR